MRRAWICLLMVAMLASGSRLLLGQGECPGQHCSAKAAIINTMCKNLGQAGGVVYVEHAGSYCWCKCSCLASSTLVETQPSAWKKIGDMKVGERVLALQKNGDWKDSPIVFSDGTTMPEQPYPYAIYVTLEGNGGALITTAEHLFLTPGNVLKRADRLTPSDKLLDKNLRPIGITTVVSGSYHGPIHNIAATSWNTSGDDMWGHLIHTAGVVSGDYYAELYLNSADLRKLPQIGSEEYVAAVTKPKDAPQLKDVIDFGDGNSFVPAKPFKRPANRVSFLPEGHDVAKPGWQRPLNDTVPYEMAVYLVNHFKVYYPEIEFHIEWSDNTVNAYAWRENGKEHVAILGGLLRHMAIGVEGAGLVLAHEIGHHRGGEPRYPAPNDWASCEGQSDYWGALVCMRKVWWGPYALEQTKKGAEQLYDLFSNGLSIGNLITDPPKVTNDCGHPPALCRFNTYLAAMRLDDKPACAGRATTKTAKIDRVPFRESEMPVTPTLADNPKESDTPQSTGEVSVLKSRSIKR